MSRILRLSACAAAMLAVAVATAALLKDEPGRTSGSPEISGKIVGLTEHQERRAASEPSTGSVPMDQQKASVSGDMPEKAGAPAFSKRSGENEKSAVSASSAELPVAERKENSVLESADKLAVSNAVQEAKAPEQDTSGKAEHSSHTPISEKAEVDRSDKAATDKAASRPAPSNRLEQHHEDGAPSEAHKSQSQYDRVITSARFSMKGSLIKLVLHGNAPMVGYYSILKNPDRVALDLAGNWEIKVPRVPSNRLIQAVRVGQHADKTRIVFDMKIPGRVALVPLNRNALELRIQ